MLLYTWIVMNKSAAVHMLLSNCNRYCFENECPLVYLCVIILQISIILLNFVPLGARSYISAFLFTFSVFKGHNLNAPR